MSSNAQRLAAAVLARREELDLTQLEVWQAGGPSNTTLTKVEAGLLETLTRVTAKKLDRGLRWAAGSAKAVWERGEDPVPSVAGLSGKDARWLAEQIRSADVESETRERLLRALDEERGTA